MTELFSKQIKFMEMLCQLIMFANLKSTAKKKYVFTGADLYRDPDYNKAINGHPRSLHTMRLACDLNLFIITHENGVEKIRQCTKADEYRIFGEYWECLGGSWGGRFGDDPETEEIEGWDACHFSLSYLGMK